MAYFYGEPEKSSSSSSEASSETNRKDPEEEFRIVEKCFQSEIVQSSNPDESFAKVPKMHSNVMAQPGKIRFYPSFSTNPEFRGKFRKAVSFALDQQRLTNVRNVLNK